jgi:hypothetical protein
LNVENWIIAHRQGFIEKGIEPSTTKAQQEENEKRKEEKRKEIKKA